MNPPLPTENPLPVQSDGKYPGVEKKAQDDVKLTRRKIETSRKFLDKTFYKKSKKFTQYYELNHYMNPDTFEETVATSEDRIKIAHPFANTRQVLASVYVKNPSPIVKPTTKTYTIPQEQPMEGQEAMGMANRPELVVDTSEGAKKLKATIEYVVRKSNLKRTSKMVLLEGTATGVGCMMVSGTKGGKIPTFERIPGIDIVWSHEVLDVYDSPWIARRIVKPLREIKENPEYNTKKNEVQPAKLDPKIYGELAEEYGVLWDFWDKLNDVHMVIPDGKDEDLLDGQTITELMKFDVETDKFPCDWPFIFHINEEKLTGAAGIGDIAPIESQVQEKDAIRSKQVNHIKRFDRKYLAKRGFLDESSQHQLIEGPDGTIVEVEGDIDSSKFQVVVDAPISADMYRVDQIIDQDMKTIQAAGNTAVTRGVGSGPDTLGEAQIIEGNTNILTEEKRDVANEFYGRTFRFIAQYIQQWWVESDEILVTGDGTKETDWLSYDPQTVQGEYTYEIDPESTRDNSAIYRKQANDALTVVVPLLTPGPTGQALIQIPGVAILARAFLETFPMFAKDVDTIIPEPQAAQPQEPTTPEDQMLQELIQNNDPQEVLDKINQLPENERMILQERLQNLQGQGGQPMTNQLPPQSQATSSQPSESKLTAAANRL